MTTGERMATEDMKSLSMSVLVRAVAGEVTSLLRLEFARLTPSDVQPVLLNVKQAAVYLGRTEQSVQHLIFQRDIPVVRMGRRVHLHRRDLDAWIEKNTY
jgi:excisionase family DNA binding protein